MGSVEANAYAGAVEDDLTSKARRIVAIYRPGFAETTLVLQILDSGQLQVEVLDRFLDRSGRTSYSLTETFWRTAPQ